MPLHLVTEENAADILRGLGVEYDPNWDYGFGDLPGAALMGEFADAMEQMSTGLMPQMGFKDAVLWFAPAGAFDGCLGVRVSGTGEVPVIGVEMAAIRRVCRRTGDTLLDHFHGTVAHELGHAWVASRLEEDFLGSDAEEEAVEEFSRDWVLSRQVNLFHLEALAPPARDAAVPRATG